MTDTVAKISKAKCSADTTDFYILFFKNLVLTMFTLGIYRFWAKTETRKFLWRKTELWGDRFEWTGTGAELFWGFVKAMVIIIPAFIVPLAIVGLMRNAALTVIAYVVVYPRFCSSRSTQAIRRAAIV